MKKVSFLFCVIFVFTACPQKESLGDNTDYPVIDVVNNIGDYKIVYCSDYFSSIEYIPLETTDNSFIAQEPFIITTNDSLIFISSVTRGGKIPVDRNLLVFNHSGKFLNQIGKYGNGPGEYPNFDKYFLSHEKPVVCIYDFFSRKIFEYEFNGKFICSIPTPSTMDGNWIEPHSYFGDSLFLGSLAKYDKYGYYYLLFDRNGEIVKSFPTTLFCDISDNNRGLHFPPFKIDERLYLKDDINDTIYSLESMNLQPAFVFNLGKYSHPLQKENKEDSKKIIPHANDAESMLFQQIVGTHSHLFYNVLFQLRSPSPKVAKPRMVFGFEIEDKTVFGIYDIAANTNILLDTDQHHQKGIVNDIDGGLPFFPRYYIGNDVVLDIWEAEDMLEFLTEEYFSSKPIKDRQAHQKLKEVLKNLKYDDNPVAVIAKLK